MKLALPLSLLLLISGSGAPQEKTASGALGMVAAEHREGVLAGVRILERGGNAVDAAVAAAFAMGAAMPSHSGLGGRSQLLVVLKDRAFHIDGGTQVPKSWTEKEGRLASVCVPGSLAALDLALREGGTMKLAEVMAPALEIAKKKKGPELAATLEAVAAGGAKEFYEGKIADAIAADMAERGGFVTKEDLAAYRAVKREPLRGSYRGYEVLTVDRPASGALVLAALNVLETFDMTKLSEVDREHALIESLRIAFEDRKVAVTDSKAHAKKRAAEIDFTKAGTPRVDAEEEGDTTHISVVDRDGNACAFTQSLGPWFGAGPAKGLGFYYNATQGVSGTVAPGARHVTGQSPTVLRKDGKVALVLGSAGERRIISAVTQTIHQVVDRGRNLRDAVYAPRWHWQGPHLVLESSPPDKSLALPAAALDELKKRGFGFGRFMSSPYWGRVQAVLWDATKKEWIGAADPRGSGAAAAPEK
ncbi:MAG TPA: gamma-glutamyltransferase [Planctomycetota bacterium]|nr:gamma-glutamyltransferase [Planctomycetota bacterium]